MAEFYPSADQQSVYSTAPADWAKNNFHHNLNPVLSLHQFQILYDLCSFYYVSNCFKKSLNNAYISKLKQKLQFLCLNSKRWKYS